MSQGWFVLEEKSAEKIIYLPISMRKGIEQYLPEKERELYLKRLVQALLVDETKKAFDPSSADGFYLEILSIRRAHVSSKLEFSLRVMNLSESERGFRSLGILLDLTAISAVEKLCFSLTTDNPILRAQEKQKQKAAETQKCEQGLQTVAVNSSAEEQPEEQVEQSSKEELDCLSQPLLEKRQPARRYFQPRAPVLKAILPDPPVPQPLIVKQNKKLHIPAELPALAEMAVLNVVSEFETILKKAKTQEKKLQLMREELKRRGFEWNEEQAESESELMRKWRRQLLDVLQRLIQEQVAVRPFDCVEHKTTDNWIFSFKTSEISLIFSELQAFTRELKKRWEWLDLLRKALIEKQAEFALHLEELAKLEVEVERIQPNLFLGLRFKQKYGSPVEQVVQRNRAQRERNALLRKTQFQFALQTFCRRSCAVDLHLRESLDQDLLIKLLLMDLNFHKDKLTFLVNSAKEISKMELANQAFEIAIKRAGSLLDFIETRCFGEGSTPEAVRELGELKKVVEQQQKILRFQKSQLIREESQDVGLSHFYLENATFPKLTEVFYKVLRIEVQMGIRACQARPMPEAFFGRFKSDQFLLLQSQLQLLKAVQGVVRQVYFWNQQVSLGGGRKVLTLDSGTSNQYLLSVPDGIQEMLLILNERKFAVEEKLVKIKKVAERRLRRPGFFYEKPLLRSKATQEFYKLVDNVVVDQPAKLVAVSALLEHFIETHISLQAPKLGVSGRTLSSLPRYPR